MQLPLLLVACVLALLATQVKSARVCYSLTECPTAPPRYTTGDWLQAIQQANSAGMASVQPQMDQYCECCCTEVACSHSVCGDSPVCHIPYCYKTVLDKVTKSSLKDPGFSSEVLVAAIRTQQRFRQKEKAKLMELMEQLVQSRSDESIPNFQALYPKRDGY